MPSDFHVHSSTSLSHPSVPRIRFSQRLRWPGEHPLPVFLLWALWLSAAYFAFGPDSYVRVHDNGDSHIPMLVGRPAWSTPWNSLALCGTDRVATGFHLIVLPFEMLPGWLAYGLIMLVQRFVAGYFMFRLLKDNLRIDGLPCLFAGLSYSLFAQPSNNVSWAGFTLYDALGLPGLPFLIWVLYRLRDQHRWWAWPGALGLGILLGLGVSYAFLPFILLTVFFWPLFVSPERGRLWGMLFLVVAGCVVINLPAVWAASLNAPLSHRASWTVNSPLSRGWWGSAHFVWGIFRDNAVGFGFAVTALVVWRKRDRRLLWLSILLVFSLVGILCYEPVRAALHAHLGYGAGFQFDRVYLVVPFLAAAAAALGLNLIPNEWRGGLQNWCPGPKVLACALAVALALWQSLLVNKRILVELAGGARFAALYQNPDIQRLAPTLGSSAPFRVATIATTDEPAVHPGYAWAAGLETVDGYATLYPKRYQQFWEQVIDPLLALDRDRHSYFHYWGSRVYLFSPSEGFPRASELRFSDYYRLELLSLANVRYIISRHPVQDERLSLLPSAVRDAQVRWASRDKKPKLLDILRGRAQGMPLFVYENRETFPRYFLVSGATVFEDETALLAALKYATHDDLRSTAYLVRGDAVDVPLTRPGTQSGAVTILRQTPDQVELEVVTDSPALLVAATSFSPYWKATIDGLGVPVLPAYHTFQRVTVPTGTHRVSLGYEPPYAKAAWKESKY